MTALSSPPDGAEFPKREVQNCSAGAADLELEKLCGLIALAAPPASPPSAPGFGALAGAASEISEFADSFVDREGQHRKQPSFDNDCGTFVSSAGEGDRESEEEEEEEKKEIITLWDQESADEIVTDAHSGVTSVGGAANGSSNCSWEKERVVALSADLYLNNGEAVVCNRDEKETRSPFGGREDSASKDFGSDVIAAREVVEKKVICDSLRCDGEDKRRLRSGAFAAQRETFCSRIPLPPSSCGSSARESAEEKLRRIAREGRKMAPIDPHSYTDAAHPLTKHVALSLSLDFKSSIITGTACLTLERAHVGELFLDTRDLTIDSAWDSNQKTLSYFLEKPDKIKGSLLRVVFEEEASVFSVSFKTSPGALALQWLEPSQTAGGKLPYVFTQCQAIHARSIFPCQDTPVARIQYTADVNIPAELSAVMSAAYIGRVDAESSDRAVERFVMEQPIPPYLFALAVGDITYEEVGPRTRIYAEPSELSSAAYEFAQTEKTVKLAEALFGPYDWERFDLLVMPPSFPYGGMENPRMVFLTPTIIAGDRSGVEVVAHELAHSWTGNLVSNATADDFWLNEGFTTYAERRIVEAMDGKDRAALHIGLGWQGLEEEVLRFKENPEFTQLKTNLNGIDPDEVYSKVPYEKGFQFLLRLENDVGRSAFDVFLKKYIAKFRFQSINTETFLTFLKENLPKIEERVDLDNWVHGTGIPADALRPKAGLLERVLDLADGFVSGVQLEESEIAKWEAQEWIVYLDRLPKVLSAEQISGLEERFHFSQSNNWEMKTAVLTIGAYSGYEPLFPDIEVCLNHVGRMKYLKPLYQGLLQSSPVAKAYAKRVFAEARKKYHPIAQTVVEGLIAKYS